jgi:hypothetical protein
MNYLRKILYGVAALLLASVALSAAANKTFIIAVPAAVTATTTSVDVTVTITGNSNGSSFEIDWLSNPNFTVTGGVIKGTNQPGTLVNPGQTGAGYKGIQFTFTSPIKTSVTATLSVTVTPACTTAPVTWNAFAWTGGVGTPSSSFTLQGGPYSTTLPALAHCTLSFTQQPRDAFIGYTITSVPFNSGGLPPVTVQATSDSGPVAGVSVSVTATAACVIGGAAVTTDASGNATFALSSGAAATYPPQPPTLANPGCMLTATAPGGFASATSASPGFTVVLKNGILSCVSGDLNNPNTAGDLNPLSPTPPTGNPDWGLVRGLNTHGDCGANVPYAFNLDQANNAASFTEDSLGQTTSVEYVILWPLVPIDSDGWAGKQPCVSWGTGTANPTFTSDPVYGCKGDFEPALLCLSGDVGAGDAVMPTIPNSAPYTLAGTEPQYQYGIDPATGQLRKAKVCVAQHGSTAANGQVQYWTKVIDQADAGIRLP